MGLRLGAPSLYTTQRLEPVVRVPGVELWSAHLVLKIFDYPPHIRTQVILQARCPEMSPFTSGLLNVEGNILILTYNA